MSGKFLVSGLVSCLLSSVPSILRADEGMWLPSLISERISDMQEKGFRLDAEDIYSINQASLKDAVVLFGRGCTGEVISSEGLLLTNHHCGYSQIQKHSSTEHDYLKDGFWAMSRDEELPNEGLTVSFLEKMTDVTAKVLEGCGDCSDESVRDSVVKENIRKILDDVKGGGRAEGSDGSSGNAASGREAKVEALYNGNQYFLFEYRVYSDVRLVGAPPSSVGKFGGDTDNWMWPRHTGDFSIFRIYADKNNNPAPYSPDNVPYRPGKYLTISTEGVSEGDFTMIYGFPGRTQEYLMSEGVRYVSEISDPHKIALRTKRLDIQREYMSRSQATRIKYSSKNAGVANAWKKWQGEMKGINRLKTVALKKEYERKFNEWAAGTEYEGLLCDLDSLYRAVSEWMFAKEYLQETARTVEVAAFAGKYVDAPDSARHKIAEAFFKDYDRDIDRECFIAVMEAFAENIDSDLYPEYLEEQLGRHSSVSEWADSLFANTVFADSSSLTAVCGDSVLLKKDPAYVFAREFEKWYTDVIAPHLDPLMKEIALKNRKYMKGQMEFDPDFPFYPDANLTLRVAYGHIKGYAPFDGCYYEPVSTLEGIMEKDNPEIFDYDIPQKLRDIHESGDYGRWGVEIGGRVTVPVCFIATNHTSGGNSGSPVLNADGELVGINFDRVWEGTMSDIDYDPDFCRNIALDIRYVLFIIDRLAGAGHLLDEMTIDGR